MLGSRGIVGKLDSLTKIGTFDFIIITLPLHPLVEFLCINNPETWQIYKWNNTTGGDRTR